MKDIREHREIIRAQIKSQLNNHMQFLNLRLLKGDDLSTIAAFLTTDIIVAIQNAENSDTLN